MNVYTQVIETAKALRGAEQVDAAPVVAKSYHAYMGNGVELLLEAIEYGIEGDALDARIQQWRADSPVAAVEEKAIVAHIERQVAKLAKLKASKPGPANWAPKTSSKNLGYWKSPTAHRIKRTASNQLISSGELEGKGEYLSRLSQYEVHPDFGPWIENWLAEHQPINRKGLAPGVSFTKDPVLPVGYITQPEQPWKIPVAQTVEHWASDARLIEFEFCKDRKQFASHTREFWSKVDTAAKDGQKLLVLVPAAVFKYRFGKRKA